MVQMIVSSIWLFSLASLDSENAASGVLVKQPVTYEDYMKLLWVNTANKTKDSLDKLLVTFCSAYEKFENESISSLAVSISCSRGKKSTVFDLVTAL